MAKNKKYKEICFLREMATNIVTCKVENAFVMAGEQTYAAILYVGGFPMVTFGFSFIREQAEITREQMIAKYFWVPELFQVNKN